MEKQLEKYTIIYNDCDNDYLDKIIDTLNNEFDRILAFFKVEKLSKPLIVKLYDDVNEFINVANYNYDWMVGFADNQSNNYIVNVLSYNKMIQRRSHKNDSLDQLFTLVTHEFTHIVHGEAVKKQGHSLMWVHEGIATTITHQYDGSDFILDAKLEDLLEENIVNNYSNYYTLMHYVIETYGNDYALKLCLDKDFAIKETPKIYNEVKEILNRQKVDNFGSIK